MDVAEKALQEGLGIAADQELGQLPHGGPHDGEELRRCRGQEDRRREGVIFSLAEEGPVLRESSEAGERFVGVFERD